MSASPCTTSSGALIAAARCGIVSPTPISALATPAGSLPWCTSGSFSYAATTCGSRETASAGRFSTGNPGATRPSALAASTITGDTEAWAATAGPDSTMAA